MGLRSSEHGQGYVRASFAWGKYQFLDMIPPLAKRLSMQASDHAFQATIPVRLPYRVFLPDRYNPSGSTDYPLIIFLHGAGARGEDLAQVEELGLADKLARGYSLPFIVVAPQCPRNLDWSMILPALDALVLHILQTFRVDPDRVYLTGLSMGGFGVWAQPLIRIILQRSRQSVAGAAGSSISLTVSETSSTSLSGVFMATRMQRYPSRSLSEWSRL
jgi:poly(3-hydroxybutyrate) depolymerase